MRDPYRLCYRCQKEVVQNGSYRCRECHRLEVLAYARSPKGKVNHVLYRQSKRQEINTRIRLRAAEKKALIASLKAGPCVECGEKFPPCCMDFDHVRGEKRRGVSRLVAYSRETILCETAKCDLVCANCHRVRTDNRRSPSKKLAGIRAKMNSLKASACMDCGKHFPAVAMDFDHVRGPKLRPVAAMKEQQWAKVLVEVAKCDLVCANCHRQRTEVRK